MACAKSNPDCSIRLVLEPDETYAYCDEHKRFVQCSFATEIRYNVHLGGVRFYPNSKIHKRVYLPAR